MEHSLISEHIDDFYKPSYVRGRVIDEYLEIENNINRVLTEYFCTDYGRSLKFSSVVLDEMTFEQKIQIVENLFALTGKGDKKIDYDKRSLSSLLREANKTYNLFIKCNVRLETHDTKNVLYYILSSSDGGIVKVFTETELYQLVVCLQNACIQFSNVVKMLKNQGDFKTFEF